jgi:hypothetical protein
MMRKSFWIAAAIVLGALALVAIYVDRSAAAGALAVMTAVAAVFAARAGGGRATEEDKPTRR